MTILDAGRATLELADPSHAEYIDEVEVGRRVAGHIRVAFKVGDSAAVTGRLAAAGATVIAEPVRTPWNSLNSRLDAPGDLQLTLFADAPDEVLGLRLGGVCSGAALDSEALDSEVGASI